MNIQTRLANLENLVNYLVKTINKDKFYTGADISGVRQNISEVTPYTETKTAYIGDTEVVFKDLPSGAYNVSFNKSVMAKKVMKEDFTDGTSTITIEFELLEEVTEVTISII